MRFNKYIVPAFYAATFPNGSVYSVRAVGDVEPDPELLLGRVCYRGAIVVAVVADHVLWSRAAEALRRCVQSCQGLTGALVDEAERYLAGDRQLAAAGGAK